MDVSAVWHAPTESGGAPIASYVVVLSSGDSFSTTDQLPGTQLRWSLGGLDVRPQPYTFNVTAINAAGVESEAATVTAEMQLRPLKLEPSPPTIVASRGLVASPGHLLAVVTWAPPQHTGSAPLRAYDTYRLDLVPDGALAKAVTTWTTATSVTTQGLDPNATYMFNVSAVNALNMTSVPASGRVTVATTEYPGDHQTEGTLPVVVP